MHRSMLAIVWAIVTVLHRKTACEVKKILALPHLLTAKQVHGSEIYCLTEPLIEDREVEGFDALITDLSGVGLMIQQADCQAVLLFDPVREVIAAVHCGWRGSVQAILLRVIAAMTKQLWDGAGGSTGDDQPVAWTLLCRICQLPTGTSGRVSALYGPG